MAESKNVRFNFKSRNIVDDAGNVIAKAKKQPTVEVALPLPTGQDIVDYLTDASKVKESAMIVDAVATLIISQAREQFNDMIEAFGDDTEKEVSASMLDFGKLNLEYIASIPPAQRGATAISDEEWTAFFEDYLAVMVAATGKEEKKIKNHIEFFKRPQKVRSNKPVLNALVEQLDIYMSASNALEDTSACATRIRDKFDRWYTEPEKAVTLDLL